MPKAKNFLTTSEYAVLGLLTRQPAHGYELQRQLGSGSGISRVVRVEPAMVYAILKSLSGLELIDGEWDRSEYPPKAVYAATTAGEAEFEGWLRRPVARMREVRSDFLVKLYFALESDSRLASELVVSQVDACRLYLLEAEAELSGAESGTFDAMVIDSKVSAARLTLAWLQRWQPLLTAKAGNA